MKPEQLRSSAAGLRDHGHEYHGAACDMEEAADRIASLEAEVTTLRVQLTAAQSLRLGRAPTVEEVKKHGVGVGRWLVHFAGDAADRWHEVCFRPCEDEDAQPTDFMIDEVGWTDIAVDYDDSIPLDNAGQPCPCGGWGGEVSPTKSGPPRYTGAKQTQKIFVVKALRVITGCHLKPAKEAAEAEWLLTECPITDCAGRSWDMTEHRSALEQAGAVIVGGWGGAR